MQYIELYRAVYFKVSAISPSSDESLFNDKLYTGIAHCITMDASKHIKSTDNYIDSTFS